MNVLINIWPNFILKHVGDYYANNEIASLGDQFSDMSFNQVTSKKEVAIANLRALTLNVAYKLKMLNRNEKILQPLHNLACSSYLSQGYLDKLAPDVIFAHSHIPRIGNKGTIPLVAVEYLASSRYMSMVGVLQTLNREIEAKQWATERASVIVTTTPGSKSRFEEYIPDVRGRLRQIPIYMPYLEPISEEEIAKKGSLDSRINVLFIGGAARRKGLPQVVEALRTLSKTIRQAVRLTVVSNFQDGEVLSIEHEAEVVSKLSGEQLSELLRAAQIFIFPTQFETYGRVIIEAMANGCAIISSNTDPQDWMLDFGKAGVLVDPKSVDEIAAALSMLVENDQRRVQFAIAARRRFKKVFYHRVTGTQYRCAFDTAINC